MKFRFALPLWLEIALAILLALAMTNVATILLFRAEGDRRIARFGTEMQSQRIAAAANVVLESPERLRKDLIKALSSPGMRLSLDAAPAVADTAVRDGAVEEAISSRLKAAAPGTVHVHMTSDAEREARRPPRPQPTASSGDQPSPSLPEPPDHLIVSVPAGEGVWLNARLGLTPPHLPEGALLWSAAAVLGVLLLVSLWIGQRVAGPLQRLAEAAALLRRGELRGTVPETGPAPVREAARSFNAMSERVMAMLKSQRAMMAAVAHDLRTPISVLRFRAEMVQDEETRARINETLAEMQGMTEAVLDAVRFDGTGEAARAVDVAVLAESLCADMAELGADVAYQSDVVVTCMCRAAELRRALSNLIENAVRYGKRARVSAEIRDGFAAIHVDDEGPGIPEADLERVFEPFARLDESRSKETGGYGLGLSIARLIARGHGGDVTLANRAGGGLRATLMVPVS